MDVLEVGASGTIYFGGTAALGWTFTVGCSWNFGSSGARKTYGRTGNREAGNALAVDRAHTIDSSDATNIFGCVCVCV